MRVLKEEKFVTFTEFEVFNDSNNDLLYKSR